MIQNREIFASVDARVVRNARIFASMSVYGVSQGDAARALSSLLHHAAVAIDAAASDTVIGVIEPFHLEIDIRRYAP